MEIIALNESAELQLNTFDADNASVTFTGTTVKVYPKGSDTERTSSAGITLSKDNDSTTGVHKVTIDTGDNTDAGFYVNGQTYDVRLTSLTIDSQTVNAYIGSFMIDHRILCEVDTTGQTLADEDRSMFETDTAGAVSALQGFHNCKKITWHHTSSMAGEAPTFVTDSKQYGTNELLKVAPMTQAPTDNDKFYLG